MIRSRPLKQPLGPILPLVCLLAWSCGGEERTSSADLPRGIRHVLLISLDTLRADHLGCYGHEYVQTPTLDRLAQEGVLFERCMSSAPTTLASHTSIFTGVYPHTHGVPRNGYLVNDENQMLAELLRDQGFRTAGFAGAAPLAEEVNFHQGFDEYDASFSVTEGLRAGLFQRPANEVTDAALDWLAGRDSSADERFFLFLHYYDIHAPYVFPAPFAGMYSKDGLSVDASMDGLNALRQKLNWEGREPGQPGKAPEDGFGGRLRERDGPGLAKARRMAAEYAAGVTFTDHHLGRLFEGMRASGVLDETLVIVTADHGETHFEHANTFDHGATVFDSVSHVPWILRLPEARQAGRRVGTVVSNIDILPTLMSLLEFPVPSEVEGFDLTDELEGRAVNRPPVFSEATKPFNGPRFNSNKLWLNQGKFQAVRTASHKYMLRLPDQKFGLYDLRADPTEQSNLLQAAGEFDDALHTELDGALRAWRMEASPLSATESRSEAQLDALDALGYTGADEE